jgi:hypothetical protein
MVVAVLERNAPCFEAASNDAVIFVR